MDNVADHGLPSKFRRLARKEPGTAALRSETDAAMANITRVIRCAYGHSAEIALPTSCAGRRLRCSKCGRVTRWSVLRPHIREIAASKTPSRRATKAARTRVARNVRLIGDRGCRGDPAEPSGGVRSLRARKTEGVVGIRAFLPGGNNNFPWQDGHRWQIEPVHALQRENYKAGRG
jgi:hypothetical protein